METGLGELLKKCEADRVIFQMWLKELCPTLETLRTIRKVIPEKQKHEEDLAVTSGLDETNANS
jgi:hypothetical protein